MTIRVVPFASQGARPGTPGWTGPLGRAGKGRGRLLVVVATAAALAALVPLLPTYPIADRAPAPPSPRVLVHRGQPLILIGAAGNHTAQSLEQVAADLDARARLGINFGRFWNLLPWESPNTLWPWRRVEGFGTANDGLGKFDLTQWDERYWTHVRRIAAMARERGFIYAWQLFDDVGLEPRPERWPRHPFHPSNNINGLGLSPVAADKNGPGQFHDLSNAALVALQEAYVDRSVRELGPLGSVIFEVENESDADYHWGRFWIDRIAATGNLTLHNPFVDEQHYLQHATLDLFAVHGLEPTATNRWMVDRMGYGRLLVYAEQNRTMSRQDMLHIVWGALLAKGTFTWDEVRPHTDFAEVASAHAARFLATLGRRYVAMRPLNENVASGHAYCAGIPGEEYVVFSYRGGPVDMFLPDAWATARFAGAWFDPATGRSAAADGAAIGRGRWRFQRPDNRPWVLHLKREG